MNENEQILYQSPAKPQRSSKKNGVSTRKTGEVTSGEPVRKNTLRLSPLDEELVYEIYMAGFLRTDQIAALRRFLAARQGKPVAEKTLLRVTQRRLQQMVQAGVLRRIEQPVFLRERSGPKPHLFTLDRYGAHLVAQRLGVPIREIDWKPRDAERNLLFMDHTLAVSDFRLALQQACLDHGVTLADWTGEQVLRRSPAKLEISGDDNASVTVSLVPDGFCKLVLPSGHATWIFLEIDRGTVTVQPRQWQLKSWRRKILAYRRLQESGLLNEHYNADSMIVATVTTSVTRMENILKTAVQAEADHRFWFTTFDKVDYRTLLCDPIWTVAGLETKRQQLLPDGKVLS